MTGRERIWMRHPALPDRDPTAVTPSQFPVHAKRGWLEVKSPTARRRRRIHPPTEGATPSEEDTP